MKNNIVEMIRQTTKSLTWEKMDEFTASGISACLGVSRNVVSQYLNELMKDEVLVKVMTTPKRGGMKTPYKGVILAAPKGCFNAAKEFHLR